MMRFFLMGLSFGAGPCMASCGPILISYIAGTKRSMLQSFYVYVIFSLSRISVYLVLGLFIFSLGKVFVEQLFQGISRYIFIAGGIFIVIMGILTALGKHWGERHCRFLYNKLLERDKKSVFLLGLIIGLLPCAPLIALFSYIGLISKTWINGILYSLAFGLGTIASPLVFLMLAAGGISRFMRDKKLAYEWIFPFICGVIIIYLGMQLLIKAG